MNLEKELELFIADRRDPVDRCITPALAEGNLKSRKDRKSRQIIFAGEKLDMEAVYRVRDGFFPP